MVLHALGVRVGDLRGHAERPEKGGHDLMPPAGEPGELAARRGEKDGAIRQGRHQPGAAQALDRAVDRDVGDAQAPGQIGHAGLPFGRDQFGDHLDIVLGGFAGVLLAGAAEPDPVRGEAGLRGLGHRAKDAQVPEKGKSVDSGDGICSVGYNLETEPKDSGGPAASGHTSLEGMHGTVNVPPQSAGFWRQWRAFAGPAILISVGYMDPGNWGTDLAGGAQYKYALLPVVALASLMAVILQVISARVGVATGKDLAQCCRDYYPEWTRWPNWISMEIAIGMTDLAEALGPRQGDVEEHVQGHRAADAPAAARRALDPARHPLQHDRHGRGPRGRLPRRWSSTARRA